MDLRLTIVSRAARGYVPRVSSSEVHGLLVGVLHFSLRSLLSDWDCQWALYFLIDFWPY
jgi:hypothetical protein